MTTPILQVKDINQYYGGSHILRGVSLEARLGKVTVLLGRNGVEPALPGHSGCPLEGEAAAGRFGGGANLSAKVHLDHFFVILNLS